jgi:hypothetical protein
MNCRIYLGLFIPEKLCLFGNRGVLTILYLIGAGPRRGHPGQADSLALLQSDKFFQYLLNTYLGEAGRNSFSVPYRLAPRAATAGPPHNLAPIAIMRCEVHTACGYSGF